MTTTTRNPMREWRTLHGPESVRVTLAPLGVPARVGYLDGRTFIVTCCTLTPAEADAAVADAIDNPPRQVVGKLDPDDVRRILARA